MNVPGQFPSSSNFRLDKFEVVGDLPLVLLILGAHLGNIHLQLFSGRRSVESLFFDRPHLLTFCFKLLLKRGNLVIECSYIFYKSFGLCGES